MGRKITLIIALALATGFSSQAQALEYAVQRLLNGVVRLEATQLGDFPEPDIGAGIIVAREGSRAYIVTALHVLVGTGPERETSGWERRSGEIGIRVRFFGDPVSYPGKMLGQWNEDYDLAVVVVDDARLGMADIAVGFGVGSPATLTPPYPVIAIGHGGRKDWDMLNTRVSAVRNPVIQLATTKIEAGDSGGALIDVSRNLLIGMVTKTSIQGSEALSAAFIMAELDRWGIAHHLRRARTSTFMVRVPAGYFKMGAGVPGRPSPITRDIYLDSYFIDQYEVSVSDFRQFIEATRYHYRSGVKTCNYNYEERGNYPMNCVSWKDARAYCEWAEKSLPTEAQWEKAARGIDGKVFPWGNQVLSPNDAVIGTEWPQAVGSRRRDRSVYGARDMLGNVSEWVADWYSSYHLPQLKERNPSGPPSGTSRDRVLRGGSFKTTPDKANLAIRKRNLPNFGRMRFDYGFRCVLNEARQGGN